MIRKFLLAIILVLLYVPIIAQEEQNSTIKLVELSRISVEENFTYSITWHPSKDLLLGLRGILGIFIWDTNTGKIIRNFSYDDFAESLSVKWSPIGDSIAILTTRDFLPTTTLVIWDWENNKIKQVIDVADNELALEDSNEINSFYWSPGGEYIATIENHAAYLRIWSVADGELLAVHEFKNESGEVRTIYSVNWLPNSDLVVAVGSDIIAIDFMTGAVKYTVDEQDHAIEIVENLASIPQPPLLAIGENIYPNSKHRVWLWNYETQSMIEPMSEIDQDGLITNLEISPDGGYMIVDSITTIIWDLTTLESAIISSEEEKELWVSSVTWSSDGQRFAVAFFDGTIRILQIQE